MARKRSQKSMKAECDRLWSKVIRGHGSCERCGSTHYLQAAHIYSRRFVATRHDLNNGLCLCAKCHRWNHDKPLDFAKWVEEYIGGDIVNELSRKAHALTRKWDYEPVLNLLKDIVKRNDL